MGMETGGGFLAMGGGLIEKALSWACSPRSRPRPSVHDDAPHAEVDSDGRGDCGPASTTLGREAT